MVDTWAWPERLSNACTRCSTNWATSASSSPGPSRLGPPVVTDDQSERLKPYSEAHRRLKQLVAELERLSLELIKQAEDIDLGYPANVGDRQAKAGN